MDTHKKTTGSLADVRIMFCVCGGIIPIYRDVVTKPTSRLNRPEISGKQRAPTSPTTDTLVMPIY